ncbi:MAG: hypothetical protein AAFY65_16590 [Pseudomonadota bacterium]
MTIVAGAIAMCMGLVVGSVAMISGHLPGLPAAETTVAAHLWAGIPGALLVLFGAGLVLRGVDLRLSYRILAELRALDLQQQAHAARTPLVRTTASQSACQNPNVPTVTPQQPNPEPVTAHIPQRQVVRASRDAPIKGKPFQPHKIFMARPLKS